MNVEPSTHLKPTFQTQLKFAQLLPIAEVRATIGEIGRTQSWHTRSCHSRAQHSCPREELQEGNVGRWGFFHPRPLRHRETRSGSRGCGRCARRPRNFGTPRGPSRTGLARCLAGLLPGRSTIGTSTTSSSTFAFRAFATATLCGPMGAAANAAHMTVAS